MTIKRTIQTLAVAGTLSFSVAFAQISAGGSANASAGVDGGLRHAVPVPTQLLGGLNAGDAKVGQQVLAKTLGAAKMFDGSSLPSGSQLMGHLTEVKQLSGGQNGTSRLKMLFDQAKTPDGQIKKIASMVSGVGGNGGANAQGSADAQGSANTQGSGGGLLGGVVNGVVGTTTNVLGAVTGLPGVLLSSTGTLSSKGKNVNLPAGTQVTVSVAAQQQ